MLVTAFEGGQPPHDSAYAVLSYLRSAQPHWHFAFLEDSPVQSSGWFERQALRSVAGMELLLRSDILLTTHGLPLRRVTRGFTVQLGHGVPIKAMGCLNAGATGPPQIPSSDWGLVCSPSRWVDVNLWAVQGVTGPVVRAALPRFDLIGPSASEGSRVLYCPTYRHAASRSVFSPVDGIGAVQAAVGSKYPLEILLHPADRGQSSESRHCESTTQLLPDTALLITDYSSAAMDAAVLGIPVVFFCPDLPQYSQDPGLSIAIDAIANGALARDAAELRALLQEVELSSPILQQPAAALARLATDLESPFGGSVVVGEAVLACLGVS